MTFGEFGDFCNNLAAADRDACERLQAPRLVRFYHGATGASTEAGELLDLAKRAAFYGADIDRVHVKEEIGDLLHYVTYMLEATGLTLDQCMQSNVDKLRKRYPDGFSTDRAVNRDLAAERVVLEG